MTIPQTPESATARGLPWWRGSAGGWALLAVGLLLVLLFGNEPERTLFWVALFDAGHVPLFGVLALAALRLLRARFPGLVPVRLWWTAFGLTVAAGAGTELIQFLQPSRDPSFSDLWHDIAGAGAFLLVAGAVPVVGGGQTPVSTRQGRRAALVAAAGLLGVALFPTAATMAAVAERDAAVPTLCRFDGSWRERPFIRLGSSRLTPGAGPSTLPAGFAEPLARLDMTPARYPGVTIDEPFPDWRAYRRLVFCVVSDLDAPLNLTIRVHDALHDQRYADRFNRTLRIVPGVNRVAIPLDDIRRAPDTREMDMARIRGIVIFGYRPSAPTHVFLGPLRLE